jgi:hypothetical protein
MNDAPDFFAPEPWRPAEGHVQRAELREQQEALYSDLWDHKPPAI